MLEDIKPHIVELRKRLGISVGVIFVMFCICFMYWEPILSWMTMPLKVALPQSSNIVFTKIQEPFFTAMKVAFFTAFIISLPVIFWQFWLFVAPGLYDHEKKMVIPFVFSATFMFLLGSAFCYYAVIPFGYAFLINFGSQLFTAMPAIGEYVGFFTKLLLAFGIAFEMPIVTFFLAKLTLVTDESLKGFFRYAIVLIFIFAAVLTPPDVVTQFLMAVPMIGLYGISILVAKAVNPSQGDEDE